MEEGLSSQHVLQIFVLLERSKRNCPECPLFTGIQPTLCGPSKHPECLNNVHPVISFAILFETASNARFLQGYKFPQSTLCIFVSTNSILYNAKHTVDSQKITYLFHMIFLYFLLCAFICSLNFV